MSGIFNATWLMAQEFPAIQYAVPGIIPQGMTLLAGAPKAGKSWLVLDLAYQVASGGVGLGVLPLGAGRPVLYAALEDGASRLQSRMRNLGVEVGPHRLDFATQLEGDPMETLSTWMEDFAGADPVVILDTLGKLPRPARGGETDYARDYRVGGELKALADGNPGSSVIVVHHTRKQESTDFLDAVSGTQGLAGSADSIVVLRRKRTETTGSLSVTSRDAAEGEYRVEMIGNRWTLVGDSLEAAAAAHAAARATDNTSEHMTDVVLAVNEHPDGISPKRLKEALPDLAALVDVYLQRAVDKGRIVKIGRGLYGPVSSVSAVSSWSDSDTPNTSNTFPGADA